MEGEFLMMPLRQILAIARTEFRFAFQRSAPVVVTALIGLLVGTGLLTGFIGNWPFLNLSITMTPEQAERWTSNGFTLDEHAPFVIGAAGDMLVGGSVIAGYVMLLALLLLPVATISAIPADRVFGVSELLRSTPMTGGRYLAGKIMGMLMAVLLVAAIMLALFFAATEILFFSNLHFGISKSAGLHIIELSFMDGLPLLVWGTVIGILSGVIFRTRRMALFPGLLAGLLSLLFWSAAFHSPLLTDTAATDKVEYYLLQNYHSPAIILESRLLGQDVNLFGITNRIGFDQIVLMYLTILAVLGIAALLARFWLQWKENF
jgi:hypothetical protein